LTEGTFDGSAYSSGTALAYCTTPITTAAITPPAMMIAMSHAGIRLVRGLPLSTLRSKV